jgi:hypothetical protein
VPEGNMKHPTHECTGEGVEVRRSHQAVACRKRYVEEPRKPRRLLIRSDERKLPELGHGRGDEP